MFDSVPSDVAIAQEREAYINSWYWINQSRLTLYDTNKDEIIGEKHQINFAIIRRVVKDILYHRRMYKQESRYFRLKWILGHNGLRLVLFVFPLFQINFRFSFRLSSHDISGCWSFTTTLSYNYKAESWNCKAAFLSRINWNTIPLEINDVYTERKTECYMGILLRPIITFGNQSFG